MDALTIILDVLGILGIICFGAFLIALVADLILSVFDKHEGIFFNKNKKGKNSEQKENNDIIVYTNQEAPNKKVDYITYNNPQETQENKQSFNTQQYNSNNGFENYSDIDYDKAAQEQMQAMSFRNFDEDNKSSVNDNQTPTYAQTVPAYTEPVVESNKESDEDVEEIINEVVALAVKELEIEKAKDKSKVEQSEEDFSKVKVVMPVVEEEPNEEDEFKQLREDVFNIRRAAFNDLQDKTRANKESLANKEYKERLKELEDLRKEKAKINSEREELLKFKEEALAKNKEYEEENEKLQKQLKQYEVAKGEISTAYFTKEEYLEKLDNLTKELKQAEKELKKNKKDFLPLYRVHKSYEKDSQKLKRKEAIVAKHKISIYGVSNAAAIDDKKKQKLEEEVEILRKLQDSVQHCEKVIADNKDTYPVLKKANEILTTNVDKIKEEIEVCKKALKWFEENK